MDISQFRDYDNRLISFNNFPNREIDKEQLAEAGFYYTSIGDIVRCPFCFIEGYQWISGDDPMEDHKLWNPNCPFVQSKHFKNETLVIVPNQLVLLNEPQLLSEEPKPIPNPENNSVLSRCTVCYVNERSVLFLPCGHVAVCTSCYVNLITCAICRTIVKHNIRIYLS